MKSPPRFPSPLTPKLLTFYYFADFLMSICYLVLALITLATHTEEEKTINYSQAEEEWGDSFIFLSCVEEKEIGKSLLSS